MEKRDASQILGAAQQGARPALVAALLLAGLLLASCGQRGALFLPPGPTTAPTGSPGAPLPANTTKPEKPTR